MIGCKIFNSLSTTQAITNNSSAPYIAQVVETSITVNNIPVQGYLQPDGYAQPTLRNDSWVQTFHNSKLVFDQSRNTTLLHSFFFCFASTSPRTAKEFAKIASVSTGKLGIVAKRRLKFAREARSNTYF